MKIKILFLLILSSLLYACSNDTTIYFKKDLILDYGSDDSPLSLIEKIGNTVVDKKMIDNNSLIVNNIKLSCNSIDTKTEGVYNIEIKTSDPNNPLYKIQVTVKDISPPTIKMKNLNSSKQIEINESDLKGLDLSTYIDVKDNFDTSPITQITTDKSITSPGTYTIKITSTDKNENKSNVEVQVLVKGEQKKEETSKNNNQNSNSSNENSSNKKNSSQSNNTTTNPPSTPAPKEQNTCNTRTPPIKEFTIDTYTSFEECENACLQYLKSVSWCGIKKAEPFKKDGVYVGYRTVYEKIK